MAAGIASSTARNRRSLSRRSASAWSSAVKSRLTHRALMNSPPRNCALELIRTCLTDPSLARSFAEDLISFSPRKSRARTPSIAARYVKFRNRATNDISLRVTEQVEFRLVGTQNGSVGPEPMHGGNGILKKIIKIKHFQL